MDSWNKLNETPFPNKEDFYSNLNMEGINDTNHRHPKRVLITKIIKNF